MIAWKGQFNEKLHQIEEEILLHVSQKPNATEEMVLLLIFSCFLHSFSLIFIQKPFSTESFDQKHNFRAQTQYFRFIEHNE